MLRAEHSIGHCLTASRAMARIPGMLKLQFYAFKFNGSQIGPFRQTVELIGKPADAGSPEMAGIPILHLVAPTKRLGKPLAKTSE